MFTQVTLILTLSLLVRLDTFNYKAYLLFSLYFNIYTKVSKYISHTHTYLVIASKVRNIQLQGLPFISTYLSRLVKKTIYKHQLPTSWPTLTLVQVNTYIRNEHRRSSPQQGLLDPPAYSTEDLEPRHRCTQILRVACFYCRDGICRGSACIPGQGTHTSPLHEIFVVKWHAAVSFTAEFVDAYFSSFSKHGGRFWKC